MHMLADAPMTPQAVGLLHRLMVDGPSRLASRPALMLHLSQVAINAPHMPTQVVELLHEAAEAGHPELLTCLEHCTHRLLRRLLLNPTQQQPHPGAAGEAAGGTAATGLGLMQAGGLGVGSPFAVDLATAAPIIQSEVPAWNAASIRDSLSVGFLQTRQATRQTNKQTY